MFRNWLKKTKALFLRRPQLFVLILAPVWLELILHVATKGSLRYLPIWALFGLALGSLSAAVFSLIARKKARAAGIAAKAWTLLVTVLYGVELVCKQILQTFYQFSTLGTAAENRLGDYAGQIVTVTVACIPYFILLLLPTFWLFLGNVTLHRIRGAGKMVAAMTQDVPVTDVAELMDPAFGAKDPAEDPMPRHAKALDISKRTPLWFLAAAIVFYLLGVLIVHLPWSGDVTPKQLYRSDTDIIDQTEQLGLFTMLRLDVWHQIVPAGGGTEEFVAAARPDDLIMPPPEAKPQPVAAVVTGPAVTTDAAVTEPEPVIDTSPNVMDVDLAAIAESTKNKDVKWLCDYFGSLTPTNKNEYTGRFKDYNVVFVLMEAFSGYAVSEEYTPTLYKLSHEGFIFNNFYTPLHYTSTSNGECQTLLGLYPKNGNPITMTRTGVLKTNCYFSLAQQLNRLGYHSYGYHNNWDLYGRMASHNNLGYSWRFATRGLDMEWRADKELKWPQRDSFMVEHSLDQYVNDEAPFNVYYLTISQHTPHSWNWVAQQYKDQLEDAPYSETVKPYIATAMEVDKAFKTLLDGLEAAGKLENTLIVACADHVPYSGVEILEDLTGKKLGSSEAVSAINESAIDFDLYRNMLIMWSASMEEPVTIDKVCCQVDILPTLSNLLGLEYDSRMLAGSDIFSTAEGMVVFSSRSWKTDRGFYDRFKQTFTPAEGVEMTPEQEEAYVEYEKQLAANKLDCTVKIIENNFYNIVFGE